MQAEKESNIVIFSKRNYLSREKAPGGTQGHACLGEMPVEMRDDRKNIYVTVEMPGMEINDMEALIKEGCLIILAKKGIKREQGTGYIADEMSRDSRELKVTIPKYVNPAKAKANYAKGVLEVVIPRAGHAGQNFERETRVEINGEHREEPWIFLD
jgi:HSP20 family molecular chaperone IbpA